ncbi:toll-like receptor 7 [Drosophila grimshawi]|uniref:GH23021 n=1 Tax=Drosophila grimshawi TaxID=7222 RepID=B4JWD8_DROGR|nr:toll-like receptor 7 [Drosophila grimshawi]EDV98276.1 GH23021 [Drosophila grimshawi]
MELRLRLLLATGLFLILLLNASWCSASSSSSSDSSSDNSATNAMLGGSDYSSLLAATQWPVAAASLPPAPAAHSGPTNQCTWTYNGTSAVHCALRLIERQPGLDLQGADGSSQLTIKCSDLYLFESQLPVAIFARLQTLETLRVASCKLLQLPNNAFEGLSTLKSLALSTRNADWAPSKTLELYPDSLNGLKQLTELDLSDNNLRALPAGFLCPVGNLQTLNLTRNRIRTAEQLGFADMNCGSGSSSNGGGGGGSGSELQLLDASHNELRTITESWGISRLRRLQHLNLQHNNISELSGEALAGLASLRIVNLSNNHLETLPEGLFAGSKELREIHLQQNELYELPKGLFHRLEQLLVVDLSGNQLTSNHVDNTTFAGLIRLIVLNLAHNALTRIDYRTFKELYFLQILNLRNNSIGHIEDNAFLPLYNLHTLNLAENRLHTLDDKLFNGLYVLSKLTLNNNLISVVEPAVFKNCSDLKELDLSSNQLNEVPRALQDLAMLRTLDLGENQIRTFDNQSFKNLHQLTGLRLIDNQIGNITVGMFADLPRLSVLNLAKNRIQSIERGAFDKNYELEAIRLDRNFLSDINGVFATLVSLLWLNLSENHLVWFDYAFIPSNLKWLDIHGNYIEALGNYYKLQEEIRVKTLDASHNRITEIGPMSIPNTIELLFINNNLIGNVLANAFVDKSNLARVDLYANQLSKLQLQQLRIAPVVAPKPLPEFYLGGNPFECDCTMDWLQRINNLTTRQHPRVMDMPNIECVMPHARGATVRPLSALRSQDFLCRYESHCFALCHCCDFDACDCEMTCPHNCTCYHDQIWSTNVVDCGNQLTMELPRRVPMDSSIVYLDGNNFPVLKNHAFIGRKNLKALYVNGSQVAAIQNRTFASLATLQVLQLSDNRLQTLHGYEFEQLSALRELYLHNNQLANIENATLAPLTSLEVLRLDGNRLVTLPIWQLHATHFGQRLRAISLGRNQWSCRCQFLQALTSYVAENALIVQDAQDIYCMAAPNAGATNGYEQSSSGSGTGSSSDQLATQKRELDFNATGAACTDYYSGGSMLQHGIPESYIPLLAAALALVFLLVVVIMVFVFRESLRIWLFAHYGVRVFGPRCEESEKLYDALLLHSAKDSEFVCQHLASELETGRPALRVCLQHRDLTLGHDATHYQLLEASRVSRRVVILLTRNFLQTEWSRCELRRSLHDALRGRPQKLVIIEEPEVAFEAESDIELLPYLKTSAVHRIRRTDRHFWEKLRYALPVDYPTYRGNNYTLDHNHERIKQPASPGLLYRQAPPPAYCGPAEAAAAAAAVAAEQNYSTATTATPSPRPQRRSGGDCATSSAGAGGQHHHQQQQQQQQHLHAQYYQHHGGMRPPSEHIYSSIDSDYSTLDNEQHMLMMPAGANAVAAAAAAPLPPIEAQRAQTWRPQAKQQLQTAHAGTLNPTTALKVNPQQQQQHQQQQHQQQQHQHQQQASVSSSASGQQQGPHVQAYLV